MSRLSGFLASAFVAATSFSASAAPTAAQLLAVLEPSDRAKLLRGEIVVMARPKQETTDAGLAVSIGARIAALAAPGEVLVSSTVKDLVAGASLRFEERGEHELKGIPETWRLFAVVP